MGSVLSSLARRASASPAHSEPDRVGPARTPANLPFALPTRAFDDEPTGEPVAEPPSTPTVPTPNQGPATPMGDVSPGPSPRPAAVRIAAPPVDATDAPPSVAKPEPVPGSAATPPTVRDIAPQDHDSFPVSARSAAAASKMTSPKESQAHATHPRVPEGRADTTHIATTPAQRPAAAIARPLPEYPRQPAVPSTPQLAILPSPSTAAQPAPRTIDIRIGRVEITTEQQIPNPIRHAPVWTSETGRDPFGGDGAARSWTDRSGSWG